MGKRGLRPVYYRNKFAKLGYKTKDFKFAKDWNVPIKFTGIRDKISPKELNDFIVYDNRRMRNDIKIYNRLRKENDKDLIALGKKPKKYVTAQDFAKKSRHWNRERITKYKERHYVIPEIKHKKIGAYPNLEKYYNVYSSDNGKFDYMLPNESLKYNYFGVLQELYQELAEYELGVNEFSDYIETLAQSYPIFEFWNRMKYLEKVSGNVFKRLLGSPETDDYTGSDFTTSRVDEIRYILRSADEVLTRDGFRKYHRLDEYKEFKKLVM